MSVASRKPLPPWLSGLRLPRGLTAIRLPRALTGIRGRFNATGTAGPRRILVLAGIGGAVGAVLLALTLHRSTPDLVSHPGRLPAADPLPGGLNTTPYQDALTTRSNQEAAAKQRDAGESFTPQIAPSQSYADKSAKKTRALLTSPPPPEPAKASPEAVPASLTTNDTAASPAAIRVASPQDQNGGQARSGTQANDPYSAAIARMMGGWGSRPPRTEVILPPDQAEAQEDPRSRGGPRGAQQGSGDAAPAVASPASAGSGRPSRGRVLIPAGRGVYAHSVLAANSDQNSPVVLEADSGPIAHARLIGSFSREDDRLVIRVTKMSYGGHDVGVDGIAVAPGTMEAGVASSVDQHYVARFALPAAAAFVAGLGQAFAQSNSTVVAGPLGGATAFQRLNLGQQLGVGAGVAGGRIGQALDQAAPRGPTAKLDVNSSVGIMFLSDVTAAD